MSKPAFERTCPRGDKLATKVWNILIQGEDEGWVSGLPPDAAERLDRAVNEYCVDDDEYRAMRKQPLCADGGPDVLSLEP